MTGIKIIYDSVSEAHIPILLYYVKRASPWLSSACLGKSKLETQCPGVVMDAQAFLQS